MDPFARYIQQAQEIESQGLACSTNKVYRNRLAKYEQDMRTIFGQEPYPLTHEKMVGYLTYRREKGKAFSTLLNTVTAFSHHLRSQGEENLTVSIAFKRFKSGLKRTMLGAKYPNQKEPFEKEWFARLAKSMDLATHDDRLFFLTMTMAYSFFMRISEVRSLRPCDVEIDEENKVMRVQFWKTKTDQFGSGTVCYIAISDNIACPAKYCDVLKTLPENSPIWTITDTALNSKLRAKLRGIGIEKLERYSFHSFRRGGAYHASERGVQDCVIKAHGRWKSEAYMRYVRVDAVHAGREIAEALNG